MDVLNLAMYRNYYEWDISYSHFLLAGVVLKTAVCFTGFFIDKTLALT